MGTVAEVRDITKGGILMSLANDARLKQIAKKHCRKLRKNQTPAEKIFWEAVRNRKYSGLKFYRQYPLFFDYFGRETFYIADFYCFEKRLAVEIDGKIHDYQKERDQLRTFIINIMNINVIRFSNGEIMEDITGALERLAETVHRRT